MVAQSRRVFRAPGAESLQEGQPDDPVNGVLVSSVNVTRWNVTVPGRNTGTHVPDAETRWHRHCTGTCVGISPLFCAVRYNITYATLKCDSGLPLIGVDGTGLVSQPGGNATQAFANVTQPASDAIGGDLLLSFKGSQFAQVPVNASARSLRDFLLTLKTGASLAAVSVVACP